MNRKERRLKQKELKSGHSEEGLISRLQEALGHYQVGQYKAAANSCRKLLRIAPDFPDALNLAASVHMALGETKRSVRILRKLTEVQPLNPEAFFNLGTAQSADGDVESAVYSLEAALRLREDYPEAYYNLGNARRQIEDLNGAVTCYLRSLDLDPAFPGAATNLASAYLEQGRASEASAACEQALKHFPGDRDALAFSAIAATESGDADRASVVLSMDQLILSRDFDAPEGYASLEEFNDTLVRHVLSHPTLTREPHNMATRKGQQTENLSAENKGPIEQLELMIGERLDDYLTSIRRLSEHPYPALIPVLTKIDIWGTVLDRQGHQAAHMHRNAWVSGVYYAQLPDVMRTDNTAKSGWIEFGRPPEEFPCSEEHEVKLFEPKEGRMFMFPSYAYHRTIPFESSQQRISIAFDLLA